MNKNSKTVPVPDYEQIVNCMHCGMCLPTCPTYVLTGLEKYSPRGRIRMFKEIAEGNMDISQSYIQSIDACLDCQACVTACPAGVEYGVMVEAASIQIVDYLKKNKRDSWAKTVFLNGMFKKQRHLKIMGFLLNIYQKSGLHFLISKSGILRLFSEKLHELNNLAPPVPKQKKYPPLSHAKIMLPKQPKKNRVGVVTGCVQDVFFNDVNHDTIEVLLHNGYDVIVPQAQQCCGSVFGHNGEIELAIDAAKTLIDQFYAEKVDYIIINSAGCGSFMKAYDHLLENDPVFKDKGKWAAERTKDITEFLVEKGFRVPEFEKAQKITYHEPCHLKHGQKISAQPREIIKALRGVELVELNESDWCCGSAGIYNITHYDESMALLERKYKNIKETGAEMVVTGNPGCLIQLMYGRNKFETPIVVKHPVSLLNSYYMGEKK